MILLKTIPLKINKQRKYFDAGEFVEVNLPNEKYGFSKKAISLIKENTNNNRNEKKYMKNKEIQNTKNKDKGEGYNDRV